MSYLIWILTGIAVVLGFCLGVVLGIRRDLSRESVGTIIVGYTGEGRWCTPVPESGRVPRQFGNERLCDPPCPEGQIAKITRYFTEETPNLFCKGEIKMDNEKMANEALEMAYDALKTMKPGTEEYTATVNSIAKMQETSLKDRESREAKEAKEDELQLKKRQVELDVENAEKARKIEWWKVGASIAGVVGTMALYIWNDVFEGVNDAGGIIPLSQRRKEGREILRGTWTKTK